MPATDRNGKDLRAAIDFFIKADKALLLVLLVSAFLVILRCIPLIFLPYQIDYGEGLMLDGAVRIRQSQPLYPAPFGLPVVLHVYGPVAYAAAASVLPGGAASFPAGRVLILFCSGVISLLLSTILRRWTGVEDVRPARNCSVGSSGCSGFQAGSWLFSWG